MTSIKNMSLSPNTVMRRTEGMSLNLKDILHKNNNKYVVLSLQVDEFTDYTAQLCILFNWFSIICWFQKNYLLLFQCIIVQKVKIKLIDLFKIYIARTNFPICKMVSITTDGAPAIIGTKVASLLSVKVIMTFQYLLTIIVSYILKNYVQNC